ncbi:tyrosine-type recombinase/integrase [Pseudomonas kuykendallii]|uniref:Phage integrase family protein n=1 Tax=Pseudomonas kuykendallii TaxID=1007099 RepID=A0A1H3AEF7_9PSED|nr:tyrosine-type recombinase/integrase [Pseudomonas kuykendallii]MCQ4273426.1 tyrosine-type recombinase/integrase [Pseudomonas kuykendallii]SDX27554.1 Phage integrase family protein [Pseudomonas kuykendallii]
MTARKHSDGWMADFYYGRKRVRKYGFATKSAALRYEADYLRQRSQTGRPLDDRLSDLVRLWHQLHGCTLKDAKARLSRTLAVVERLGDPLAGEFDALAWSHYRSERLKVVSPHTVNHEQRYLAAVFSELGRLGAWYGSNPLAAIRQIRTDQVELTFLSLEQVQRVLDECKASMNTHCYPVALICASTGCRWNEAETLRRSDVFGGKVHFHKTKNSRSRSIPIPEDVEALILEQGMPGQGRLFMSCRAAFRGAYDRCGFSTPGQLTHILRHTFASHFMMGGGDILTLQRILGHGDIKMTMRYSHLSPDHLASALKLSPLAQLRVA